MTQIEADRRFQFGAVATPRKSVGINQIFTADEREKLGFSKCKAVKPLCQRTVLEHKLEVFALLNKEATQTLVSVIVFAEEYQLVADIINYRLAVFIGKRQVFIKAMRKDSRPRRKRSETELFLCKLAFFGQLGGELFDLFYESVGENDLAGRGNNHLVEHFGTTLTFLIEKTHRIDRVTPKFDSNRIFHLWRKKVEYASPDGKLTDALDHIGADISRRNKPSQNLVKR